jgi:hypothetical protein
MEQRVIKRFPELVVLLRDIAAHSLSIYRVDEAGKPTLSSCNLCARWEGHDSTCPIPSIEAYIKENGGYAERNQQPTRREVAYSKVPS